MNAPSSAEPTTDIDTAIRTYCEFAGQQPPDPVPKPLRDSLQEAVSRKAAADRAVAQATTDLESKRALVSQQQRHLTAVTAAVEGNLDIEAADQLVEQQHKAQGRLKAATNMERQSARAYELAQSEAKSADSAVNRAAMAVRDAEVKAEFADFHAQVADILERRRRLLAAHVAGSRSALRPNEWAIVNKMRIHNAEELNIQLEVSWIDTPMYALRADTVRAEPADAHTPSAERARINALVRVWRERLRSLIESAGAGSTANSDAVA